MKNAFTIAIRVQAHSQTTALPTGPTDPSFRAARREMLELHAAVQRIVSNFGYDLGNPANTVEAKMEGA